MSLVIPDFSSFVPNTSGAECCLIFSGHFYVVGSSGRVCRLLGLKDALHVDWVKIIKGLIISTHSYLMRLTSIETEPL